MIELLSLVRRIAALGVDVSGVRLLVLEQRTPGVKADKRIAEAAGALRTAVNNLDGAARLLGGVMATRAHEAAAAHITERLAQEKPKP